VEPEQLEALTAFSFLAICSSTRRRLKPNVAFETSSPQIKVMVPALRFLGPRRKLAMNNQTTKPPMTRLLYKLVLAFSLFALLILVLTPWIIGNTGLRDRLLALLIDNPAVSVSTRGASLGYFSQFSVDGLHIDVEHSSTVIDLERIEASKSWPSMLIDRPELGRFVFVRPSFQVRTSERTGPSPQDLEPSPMETTASAPTAMLPNLTAEINEASVKIYGPQNTSPVVDLQNINAIFQLQRTPTHSQLVLEPTLIFDHQELTPELCDSGLQLVAPLLGNEIGAGGEFSFSIEEFRLPLIQFKTKEEIQGIVIEGTIQLHQAAIRLRETTTAKVIELVTELLGESVPDMIQVAKESEVSFRIVDGCVFHEGFVLMLPYRDSNVRLRSSGFVYLDGKLDVKMELQLPFRHFGTSQISKVLSETPIQVGISGTLENPKLQLLTESDWSAGITNLVRKLQKSQTSENQIVPSGNEQNDNPDIVTASADAAALVANRISEFLKRRQDENSNSSESDERAERRGRLIPSLRDRIQERRNRRNKEN
jgi:hypothetical protein